MMKEGSKIRNVAGAGKAVRQQCASVSQQRSKPSNPQDYARKVVRRTKKALVVDQGLHARSAADQPPLRG
jgi:hypothetical protein